MAIQSKSYDVQGGAVNGRTVSQIWGAKKKATGGKRKRCLKGKSCGASCIPGYHVCMVDIPVVLAPFVSKTRDKLMAAMSQGPPANTKIAIKPKELSKPASTKNSIKFEGNNLVVNGETFTPGKKLPGSTQPTLYVNKDGEGKWVVKEGGAKGQNIAEKAANDVYNILAPKLGSGAIKSELVDGKLVNGFVEGGKTLNSLNSTELKNYDINSKLRKSLIADALVANWDFMGAVNDNIMVNKSGALTRIDSGGTFNYRAIGASKKFESVPMELWTLRSGQGSGAWTNAKDSDYRNIWSNQAKGVAEQSRKLKKSVDESGLSPEVKVAFTNRINALATTGNAITSEKFNGKTILQLADSGAISWKSVDSAIKTAFENSKSFNPRERGWEQKVNQEVIKQLGTLAQGQEG
jgi:hypothetical protein